MKEYISKQDMKHCNEVKMIFQDMIELSEELCVVDAYPFGCVVLEWFSPEAGFDRQEYFTNASELFDYLLEKWENMYLYKMKNVHGLEDLEDSKC